MGQVLADGDGAAITVDTRNRFFKGEIVEIISPGRPITRCRVQAIRDAEGHPIERARPGFEVTVDLAQACRRGDLLRRVRRLTDDRSTDR